MSNTKEVPSKERRNLLPRIVENAVKLIAAGAVTAILAVPIWISLESWVERHSFMFQTRYVLTADCPDAEETLYYTRYEPDMRSKNFRIPGDYVMKGKYVDSYYEDGGEISSDCAVSENFQTIDWFIWKGLVIHSEKK